MNRPTCRRAAAALGAVALVIAGPAHAHEAEAPPVQAVWSAWTWEPWTMALLALSGGLYVRGVHALWRDAGVGRGIRRWEAGVFAASWLALLIALLSPLHRIGQELFSVHMGQHEVLMLVAAPLLALSHPLLAFLHALPLAARRRLGHAVRGPAVQRTWHGLTHPLVAWTVHAIALWAWHVPALFEATLHSELVHAAQHASFFLSALLFWWALIHGGPGWAGYGAAVLYVFTTAMQSGLLGVLLTFAPRVWYPTYEHTTAAWGLTPLEDQQLGGLVMWVPAGVLYLVSALALMAGWLREAEGARGRATPLLPEVRGG